LTRSAPPPEVLEAAANTGNLLCRQGAIARAIRVDDSGRVRGVAWVDHRSGQEYQSSAPLVFLCSSSLESTRLLMLSRTPKTPNGLGSNSGTLGSYLMDHVVLSAEGIGPTLGKPKVRSRKAAAFFCRASMHESSPLQSRRVDLEFSSTSPRELAVNRTLSLPRSRKCFPGSKIA
jgi:choline dehydrogenase-like flavoprotein